MSQSTLTILNDIFVQYPGDFIYFLLLIALTVISMLMAVTQLRSMTSKVIRNFSVAYGCMLIAWGCLILAALYVQFTNLETSRILPPIERVVTTASLLLIAWSFLTSDTQTSNIRRNIALVFGLIVIIFAYISTAVQWSGLALTTDFNISIFGIIWMLLPLVISIGAIVLLVALFDEIKDAPLKIVFFAVIAIGASISLVQISQGNLIGNYAGIFRLTFVMSMSVGLGVVYRSIFDTFQLTSQEAQEVSQVKVMQRLDIPITDTPQYSIVTDTEPIEVRNPADNSAQLLKALGMILEGASPDAVPQRILTTTLDILKADIAAILRVQDANYADITQAYDRIMEREINSIAINLDDQPTLVNAIERRMQRALYTDRNQDELRDLYTRLDIEQNGAVYFQPLSYRGEVLGVLMVALPYAGRELRDDETEVLTGIGILAGSLLNMSYAAQEATLRAEDRVIKAMVEGIPPSQVQADDTLQTRREMHEKMRAAREQINELNNQVHDLKQKLNLERNRLVTILDDDEDLSFSQSIVAIAEEQEILRRERDLLTTRLQEAETALRGMTSDSGDAALQNQIELLKRETEKLEAEKQRLQQSLDDILAQDKIIVGDAQTLLNRMVDEKSSLEQERAQLSDKLESIQQQLETLGINDDVTGLSQLITQLFEERSALRDQTVLLQTERDMLLRERYKLAQNITDEKMRDDRIIALEEKIEHLAADRESALKQRDKLLSERDDLENKVNDVKQHRAEIFALLSGLELEVNESRDEQVRLREEIQTLADSKSQLIEQLASMQATLQALKTERDQLLANADGDPIKLQQANQEGITALRNMIQELSQQRDVLQRELNDYQTQYANLQSQLDLQQVTTATRNGDGKHYQPQNPDLLVGLVQELRTPMTSISGYVDLLLGESAGILGEMQRKFLQRVASNISRLDTMINSLIDITELDTENYELKPRPINIVSIVEDAITNASDQFREKGLGVAMNLDDNTPPLPADKDSVTQVVGQLLTNAYLVSPPNSEITITVGQRPVRLHEGDLPRPCLYVAVEDTGGGIDPADIPRVFARKYKADNPLIQGLGDTGVGMSIAKALVEAHQGRLWVQTEQGIGSTFAFAIPLDIELQAEAE